MAKAPKSQNSDEDKEFLAIQIGFGKRVRDARKRMGLTQGQLAQAVGLAQSYVHEIENYGSNISLKGLASLATVLRVSMRDLIPDNQFDDVPQTGIAQLVQSLDSVAAAIRSLGSQQSDLGAKLDKRLSDFDALRDQLVRSLNRDTEAANNSAVLPTGDTESQ